MKRVKYFLLTAVAGFIFSMAQAQYTGPGANVEFSTIKEVNDNASRLDKADKQIKIKGFLTEQINKDNFWFKDSTGKIKVEIEKKQMPAVPFNEKTEIILFGEVDYDLLEGCEIEVDSLIINNKLP